MVATVRRIPASAPLTANSSLPEAVSSTARLSDASVTVPWISGASTEITRTAIAGPDEGVAATTASGASGSGSAGAGAAVAAKETRVPGSAALTANARRPVAVSRTARLAVVSTTVPWTCGWLIWPLSPDGKPALATRSSMADPASRPRRGSPSGPLSPVAGVAMTVPTSVVPGLGGAVVSRAAAATLSNITGVARGSPLTDRSSARTPVSRETMRNSTSSPGATLTSPTRRWALAAVSSTNSPLPSLTVPPMVPFRMAPGSRPVRAVESFSWGLALAVSEGWGAGWFWACWRPWRSPVRGCREPRGVGLGGFGPRGGEPGGAGGRGGAVLMAFC